MLEELRELGFSWIKIAEMLGLSRWTIHRRVKEYGLQNMTGFHHLPDEELDGNGIAFIWHIFCVYVYSNAFYNTLWGTFCHTA